MAVAPATIITIIVKRARSAIWEIPLFNPILTAINFGLVVVKSFGPTNKYLLP